MVVDTSALVAIMTQEPNFHLLNTKIAGADAVMAAPSVLEAFMVLTKHFGANTRSEMMVVFSQLGIAIVPFGPDQAWEAATAFEKYGKGRHLAALNYGDCMVYALAKSTGKPLLFVGDDFAKTDIDVA